MARLRKLKRKFSTSFRAVLFRMVPKHKIRDVFPKASFRAVLFRMVPKLKACVIMLKAGFRAVLFRMVPKPMKPSLNIMEVLELCCFEWFQ
ncbi:TPA: hypothetical protein ACGN5P_001991, partial [Streptococcus agalactiae]